MAIDDIYFNGKVGETFTFQPNRKDKKGKFHYYEKEKLLNGREVIVDKCTVDILIPFHGKYDLVLRLVKSILEKTRFTPYKITLIDDASPNVEFTGRIAELKQHSFYKEQIDIIRLDEHRGFGGALEAGFRNTEQPYVCFLHSDCTIVNPNWLEAMGEALLNLKPQKVRLVSARSNNPNGDIEELKGEHDEPIDDAMADSAVPLFCAMCHRKLFSRINGFIKAYPYTWYEEEELFWRMKKYNFNQGIAGKSWVSHIGAATVLDLWRGNSKVRDIMKENRERCLKDIKSLNP